MEVDYTFFPAIKDAELKEGTMKSVEVGNVEVLLVRVDGELFAINNRCGHMSAYLSEGSLQDHVVECPLHGARFDLRTGAVTKSAQINPDLTANYGPKVGTSLRQVGVRPVNRFKTRVSNGVIEVGIPGTATATGAEEEL